MGPTIEANFALEKRDAIKNENPIMEPAKKPIKAARYNGSENFIREDVKM